MVELHSYQLDAKEVLKQFDSKSTGITDAEASKRLEKYGPNKLEKKKKITPFEIFIAQFNNFLIWILLAAVGLSLAIGYLTKNPEDYIDAGVITVIVIINALLGFFQEYRAEKAMEALQKMAAPRAKAIRNNEKKVINSEELVPGDIILLETGDRVPADARIIDLFNLQIDEAALTGESVPVAKKIEKIAKETPVADRKNLVYSGTIVTRGKASAVVYSTGMGTEFGKIAALVQEDTKETPLQKKLEKVGKTIGIVMIGIAIIVFALGVLRGTDTVTMILTSISLAVAAVPEGLPAVVTITLALGLMIMAKSNAVVRKLSAVETLGSTTVICSDKTGTLTKNEMTVRLVSIGGKKLKVTGSGYDPEGELKAEKPLTTAEQTYLELLLKSSVLCNNAELISSPKAGIFGDPTEGALIVLGKKAQFDQKKLSEQYKRVYEVEFTSERKMMSTVHEGNGKGATVFAKGAPEVLLEKCSFVFDEGRVKRISPQLKKKVLSETQEMATSALRVLGFAYKEFDPKGKFTDSQAEGDFIFIGLAGMIDPPREEVIDAVKLCKSAGIRSIMITGDHKLTAEAIGKELGIESDGAMTGEELENIEAKELSERVRNISVFARVSPEHKVKILEALKANGEIVAMTGDGVNDAPAIKRADIGIAMGITGTDVAKEASDMVLQDDNFATIVKAVESGRGIYANIKNFIAFLLSGNIGEVLVIAIAILIGLKEPATGALVIPLAVSHILWINLLTDGLPAVALGFEPVDKDIMKTLPRKPGESIFAGMRAYIVEYPIILTIGTLALFVLYLPQGAVKAQTIAFTAIVFFELFQAFSCRSLIKPFYKLSPFSNKYLLGAIALSVGSQLAIIYLPLLNQVFKTVPLLPRDILVIIGFAIFGFLYLEAYKTYNYRKSYA
ncbi:TPA: cation-translocating P-type ATPase [archaeon]|nr:cation-translocating P-type ATPase [Candidatus Naiadarchaeales archaeon SRR2090159.bin1288]